MIDFDRSLLGREFETVRPVEISAEMIARFCALMGEANATLPETERDSPIAPPGFVASFRALEDIFEYLPKHVPRLAAGMDVEFAEPIGRATRSRSARSLPRPIPKPGAAAR